MKTPYPDKKAQFTAMITGKTMEELKQEVVKYYSNRFEVDEHDIEDYFADRFDELELDGILEINVCDDENWILIGKELASSYNDSIEVVNDDIPATIKEVKKLLREMGIGDAEVKLYLSGLSSY